jgi:translation initiation factor 1 (eIF-1/SUI1)
MGDRGPSKRMTMADFLRPPQPPATANRNTDTNNNTTTATISNNQDDSSKSLPLLYTVRATKKGGVPCAVESRKHHKVVVLSNIEGDVPALLSALQKLLGTGGVRKGNSIEVQGEHHLEKIKRFCLTSGCVVGASKQNKVDAQAATGKMSNNNSKKSETTTNTETTATSTIKTAVDGTAPLSQKEIKVLKPTELKEHLAARQLSTQGNKKELLARLAASVKSN